MPTYQYACTECGEQLEVVQKFSDEPLTVCPACHGRLRKVFSAVGVVFKGSGFYKTDSRASSSGSRTKSDTADGAAAAKSDTGSGGTKADSAATSSGSGSSSSSSSSDTASSSSSSGTSSGSGGDSKVA